MPRLIETVIYDVSPSVSRLGQYLYRHLRDREFALAELGRMKYSGAGDDTSLRYLFRLYLLRGQNGEVRDAVLAALDRFRKSKSSKVQWHLNRIRTDIAGE